jgi:hypothetical protein
MNEEELKVHDCPVCNCSHPTYRDTGIHAHAPRPVKRSSMKDWCGMKWNILCQWTEKVWNEWYVLITVSSVVGGICVISFGFVATIKHFDNKEEIEGIARYEAEFKVHPLTEQEKYDMRSDYVVYERDHGDRTALFIAEQNVIKHRQAQEKIRSLDEKINNIGTK